MCRNKRNKLVCGRVASAALGLAGFMIFVATPFVPSAAGAWLDIDPTTWSPGPAGSFTGTLGAGTTVTGNFGPGMTLTPVGPNFGDSTINDSSPQYSFPGIFTPTIGAADRLGYTKISGTPVSRITINFFPAVTNPVFHVANLDGSALDFSPNLGLVGMTLLSGNAGSGTDGLILSGRTLRDIDTTTVIAFPVNQSPPTAGARSAYGSVLLSGTFSTLLIDSIAPLRGGDGGSFTISTVPEPATFALVTAALGGLAVVRRKSRVDRS